MKHPCPRSQRALLPVFLCLAFLLAIAGAVGAVPDPHGVQQVLVICGAPVPR